MMAHGDGGKGSKPRKNRNNDAYADNYDKIFGNEKNRKQERALKELIRSSQDMGLYDSPNPMVRTNRR
jgi:hypothetical protein